MTAPRDAGEGMIWVERPVAPSIRRLVDGDRLHALAGLAHFSRQERSSPALLCSASCRDTIAAHLADASVERGGLLIGSAWSRAPEDQEEPLALLWVESAVPTLADEGTETSLRMDTELWARAQSLAAQDGEIILGWYHSHPGFGAFFSGTDRRTQAAVFRHPYSLGLVIDPIRGEERWFLGPRCRPIGPACQFSGRQSSLAQEQQGGEQP